jgi:Flp pilus assembly protein TadG
MKRLDLCKRFWRLFRSNRSGQVAVTFALTVLPLIGLAGLGMDYGNSLGVQNELNAAADQAALEGVSTSGNPKMTPPTQAAVTSYFTAAAANIPNVTVTSVTVTVTTSVTSLFVTVSYTATVPTNFTQVMGLHTLTVKGTASAEEQVPEYISFYLLLDVSGSMGIPSTSSEQARLAAINPDFLNLYPGGCTLACHFTAYQACQNIQGATTTCQGYNLSRTAGTNQTPVTLCPQPGMTNCIQLRLDAVGYAVQQLLTFATQTATLPNQFGVGLYPFIRYMETYEPLTTNLANVSSAAGSLASLMDNGNGSSTLGSGGTHFENALPALNSVITNLGTGLTAASPKPVVFMVTDGAQDNQYNVNDTFEGSNSATTLATSNCTTIKNRGITLAVLYVPYVPIPNPTTIWNDEDGYANANIPSIPPSLQACASPGFFFTASSPTDITNAMQVMFLSALTEARLTK